MEGFYKLEGGARKSLAKEKKGLFGARTSFLGIKDWARVLSCRLPRLPLGWGQGEGWG